MGVRIQRKRTKGWRMPEGAIYVGRPTKWGNPFEVGCNPSQFSSALPSQCDTTEEAVQHYRYFAATWITITNGRWLDRLRGHDLACWCKIGDPCHADILLELANRP